MRDINPFAQRQIPAGDIEQLVADAENKWDRNGTATALPDLCYRLRVLAGLDADGYEPEWPTLLDPMTIGRTDRCLIETPHDVSLCGKREAHR